jgi:2-C-methyl-D-erythritol 2,4-cyclodiphosphate synthase
LYFNFVRRIKKNRNTFRAGRSAARGGVCIAALGQDSHSFEPEGSAKPLVLGGVAIPGCPGLAGNSDADVVLHAITNAVSGLHGVPVLGPLSDELCLGKGVRDSRVYLAKSLEFLKGCRLVHVSVAIEAKRPRLAGYLPVMRKSIAGVCSLSQKQVALTATSGEGLTAFGRGEGIQAFAVVSALRHSA